MSMLWRTACVSLASMLRTFVQTVPPSVETSRSPTFTPPLTNDESNATAAAEKADMSTEGVRSSSSSRTSPSQLLLATAKGPVPPVLFPNSPQGSFETTDHGPPELVTRDQPGGTAPASKLSERPSRR